MICPPWDSMMVREIDSPIPMPCCFRGDERLEQLRRHIRCDAGPRVGNIDGNHVVNCGPGRDNQFATFRTLHRLNRVAQQIEQHLLNLDLVDKDEVD